MSDLTSTSGRLFFETISQNELFMRTLSSHPIVVPVPLSSEKLKKRGYNQAELLANYLSEKYNLQLESKVLVRNKSTKPQFKLNKEERQQNVQGAFDLDLKHKLLIRGSTILLIDDLSTSCATLRECAKILKRNGAKVVLGVTFAREI